MSKMCDRYIGLYKHHSAQYGPNTAIFLLVGSFYELYDIHDATGQGSTSFDRAVDILGIQKVPKGGGLVSAGFKDITLHKFATMLTRENWTVVVVDQVKDDKGAVSSRDVARILSPGTHLEAVTADTFYTCGLWLQSPTWTDTASLGPPAFGAVAFDLTTGCIQTYEGVASGRRDTWSSDDLLHFFQVHPPKEITVWWRGHAMDQPTELFLRRTLSIPGALLHIRQATSFEQRGLEKEIVREDLLRRCFKPKSLLPLKSVLGLTEYPLTERALASLLLFVEDHFASAVDMLRIPIIWVPDTSVYIGNHALTQLNMVTLREEDSVLALFLKAHTHMGKRAIRRRLLYPTTQAEELEKRFTEVAWCWTPSEVVIHSLRQIADMSRLHRKLLVAGIDANDVLALEQSYKCSLRIAAAVEDGPLAASHELRTRFGEFLGAFSTIIDIDKARRASDDLFCLTQAAGPKCAAVEGEIAAAHAAIAAIHTELSEWVGVEKEFFRLEEKEASIVVAANKSVITRTTSSIKAGGVPESLKGIQVNTKKSSSSLEIPALNRLFKKILGLRDSLARTVKEELPIACDRLSSIYSETWDELEGWVCRVDMSYTIARVSRERGFVRPEIVGGTAGASLTTTGLRHPLIESQQTRVEYVKHDVRLGVGEEQGWLVYGMNASGKSSLMKSVGIAVILAQCGCYVPATTFRFTPFRSIFTRILNTDNLWAGLSSFAVEMTELGEILRRADPWSLVLGDEVCSGTESLSAMSLVGASLDHFMRRGARCIFATHLHGLQAIPLIASLSTLKVWHLRVRFDHATQRLIYDRTLHPGAGSSLYGLEVAKAMAIPHDILEVAHAIRRSLTGATTEQEAPTSAWNAAVQRKACEVCGNPVSLEVHHLRERKEATDGHFKDGTHMNTIRNLAVLCETCHLKTHAGTIEVGPVEQTSEGPVRRVEDLAAFAYRPSPKPGGLTEEQIDVIKREIRAFPLLPPSRMLFDLEERHGIKITSQRLRTIRASIPPT